MIFEGDPTISKDVCLHTFENKTSQSNWTTF